MRVTRREVPAYCNDLAKFEDLRQQRDNAVDTRIDTEGKLQR